MNLPGFTGFESDVDPYPIPDCPAHGRQEWVIRAARVARECGLTMEEARKALWKRTTRESEAKAAEEINRATAKVYETDRPVSERGAFRFPSPDWNLVRRTLDQWRGRDTVEELARRSPVELSRVDARSVVLALFPKGPRTLVCTAKRETWGVNAATRPKEVLLREGSKTGWKEWEFIVAQPMTKLKGVPQNPRRFPNGDPIPVAWSKDNTASRRMVVVEFDPVGGPDSSAPAGALLTIPGQAALHLTLSATLPVACVVFSGSRSLHGWYCVEGKTVEQVAEFLRLAARLGGDPAPMRNRAQLVRLPGGTRSSGEYQRICYFDPASCGASAETLEKEAEYLKGRGCFE